MFWYPASLGYAINMNLPQVREEEERERQREGGARERHHRNEPPPVKHQPHTPGGDGEAQLPLAAVAILLNRRLTH